MKFGFLLALVAASFLCASCSTLPEPEKEPFGQLLEKAEEVPSGDGLVDRAIENAATTFPSSTKNSHRSSTTPPPPRH
jgi:hypothetical protein